MSRRRVPLDLHEFSGHVPIFRTNGAAMRDPEVARWLASGAVDLRSLAQISFPQYGADVRDFA